MPGHSVRAGRAGSALARGLFCLSVSVAVFASLIARPDTPVVVAASAPEAKPAAALVDELRKLDPRTAPEVDKSTHQQMLQTDLRERRTAANLASSLAWAAVKNREDWEALAGPKIEALRASLGVPYQPARPEVRTTRTHEGDGHAVDCVLYESAGLWVSGNLYRPLKADAKGPGILVVHSHHNPKTEGELQDMGVTWARAGCSVLVIDQLGHGERRTHPFTDAASYPKPFRAGRQDYWFRGNTGVQLHLAGESLTGRMAHDLRRGVDVLLARPEVDPAKIVIMGAVAGGGDPCAVTAALDTRIAMAVPFNFGGPQPESTYPLPEDAEKVFNYAGGGSWETTRNLRNSARDGFLPWVIVGSLAPRRLVYGHEFSWDRERDPVWSRLTTIRGWYGDPARLDFAHGRGLLSGRPPEASHCNNIGPIHRERIHAALVREFGIPAPVEFQQRRPATELACFTAETAALRRSLPDLLAGQWRKRTDEVRAAVEALPAERRAETVRRLWTAVVGDTKPAAGVEWTSTETANLTGVAAERFTLVTERSLRVYGMLLIPAGEGKHPCVVGVAQGGKAAFLTQRAGEIAALLEAGTAVCLVDLRGCGETRPGEGRGRTSGATSLASMEQLLGGTLLAGRVRDLRTVLAGLRKHPSVDAGRLALWGESFAPASAPDAVVAVPYEADGGMPKLSEPLGATAVLLTAVFEPGLRGVAATGGLVGFGDVVGSPFVWTPFDVLPPGAVSTGDLPVAAGLLPAGGLRLADVVDGRNRAVAIEEVKKQYPGALVAEPGGAAADVAAWLLERLKGP